MTTWARERTRAARDNSDVGYDARDLLLAAILHALRAALETSTGRGSAT
jgi:hypothetical protein